MKNIILIVFFGLIGGVLLLFGALKLYSTMHGAATNAVAPIKTDTLDLVELVVVYIPTIGKLVVKNPQKDSTNIYGAGDCWGRTIQFSNDTRTLAFDTLNCGDYGITSTTYLLENGLIKVVFIQKSITNLTLELADRTYTLSENIYDFQTTPFTISERNGEYQQPKFGLLTSDFETTKLEDQLTTFEHLNNLYIGIWAMEEDY